MNLTIAYYVVVVACSVALNVMMSVFIVGRVKVIPPNGQLVRLVSLVRCWISRKQRMIRLSQAVSGTRRTCFFCATVSISYPVLITRSVGKVNGSFYLHLILWLSLHHCNLTNQSIIKLYTAAYYISLTNNCQYDYA